MNFSPNKTPIEAIREGAFEDTYLVLNNVDENKEVSKNIKKFRTESKKKLKRLMVVKKLNIVKILEKLGSSLMLICQ